MRKRNIYLHTYAVVFAAVIVLCSRTRCGGAWIRVSFFSQTDAEALFKEPVSPGSSQGFMFLPEKAAGILSKERGAFSGYR